MKTLVLAIALLAAVSATHHHKCPAHHKKIVEEAARHYEEIDVQTQTIRRVLNDLLGGKWGVIVSDSDVDIAWTLPDTTPFFCRYRHHRWNYVLFKTNDEDVPDRYTVEDAIKEGRLLKILSRKPREYHDEHNPCDPPIHDAVVRQQHQHDDYIVRRPNY